MKLKNVIVAVEDIEKAKRFYKELFGLEVILDNDVNVVMSEGLVLQDVYIWMASIGRDVMDMSNSTVLYFEESDIEAFVKKLDEYPEPIEYVTPLTEHSWGQKVIRFYDLDGNLIEVGTPTR